MYQRVSVLPPGQDGTPDRIFPLPEPFSFSLSYHICLWSDNGRARASGSLLKSGQLVSTVSGHREDDFQRVTGSTDFPDTSPMLVKPFEEPDKRVDERDPQQQFYPHVGDEFRECVRRSDDNEVVCGREGGEFDFERATVRGLFDDQGFDGLFESTKIPAVYALWGKSQYSRNV